MIAWLVMGFVVVVLILLALIYGGGAKVEDMPYEMGKALFSPAERAFIGVLEQAVSPQYRVFGKVRVADVISAKRGMLPKQRTAAFNRIKAKHFDFVLCRTEDLKVAAVVELDDSSHDREDRRQRDQFLRRACAAAKLPLHNIKARHSYNIADLRAQLMPGESLGSPARTGRKSAPIRVEPSLGLTLPAAPSLGNCPDCNSPLTERVAEHGDLAGRRFTVCGRFPVCRYIEKEPIL